MKGGQTWNVRIEITKIYGKVTEKVDSFTHLERYKTRENFKTIYVNAEGKEEFEFNRKSTVLPMDKMLHCKVAEIKLNSLRKDKLKKLQTKYPTAKIIRRGGDENVILILEDKVISINVKGWVLEFKNIKAEHEVDEVVKEDKEENLKEIQARVKPGDYIQARYGKKLIEGKITREYGLGNEILNIVFDNKHTAIGRTSVTKILKVA
ncbi:hypothetical protein [Clostridium rectalis]|uniref:hypothetical protein n=1 Tax=Clostridium rectalis TaxID=2040295 RepID=UPI000F6378EA|nr:hypothetical protein [Clostridium rectalis]